MILYADTSALVKLVIREGGSTAMLDRFREADAVPTAAIAYAEMRATVAAIARTGRLSAEDSVAAARNVELWWARLSPISIDDPLIQDAGDLAERHALRGYDAVHLAALRRLGKPRGELAFAVWDAELREAARSLGYATIPA